MTKQIFLKKLSKASKKLPPEDRDDLLNYYEEYIQNLDDLSSLTPPKEIVKHIKKELKQNDGFDLGDSILSLTPKKSVNYGQITSAKKQLLFLALLTILLTAIFDLCQAIYPLAFSDLHTGATLFPSLCLPLIFYLSTSLLYPILLKKGIFPPLESGFQRYLLLKYLIPQFILWFFLFFNFTPYHVIEYLLDSLPCYTVFQRFLAFQAYNYAQLMTPFYLYFLLAFFSLIPMNFLVSKWNLNLKIYLPFQTALILLCTFFLTSEIAKSPNKEDAYVQYIAQHAPMSLEEKQAYLEENYAHISSYDQLKLTFDKIPEVALSSGYFSADYFQFCLTAEPHLQTEENLQKYKEIAVDATNIPPENIELFWEPQDIPSTNQLWDGYFSDVK